MSLNLLGAISTLVLWVLLTIIIPLGPSATIVHLLLGVAAAFFVRWWALRYPG
jgi:hypothetical protein